MYRDAGKKVSNKEVKAAFNDVLKDLDKSVDFLRDDTPTTSPESSRMRKTSTTTDRC